VCGAGGVMARERGAGKGREGAEGLDVDYAPIQACRVNVCYVRNRSRTATAGLDAA